MGIHWKISIDIYFTGSLTSKESYDAYRNQEVEGEITIGYVPERNRIMVDRLVPNLYQGAVFAAVGAGHLYNQYGMLQLLRDKGFTVKPVRLELIINP